MATCWTEERERACAGDINVRAAARPVAAGATRQVDSLAKSPTHERSLIGISHFDILKRHDGKGWSENRRIETRCSSSTITPPHVHTVSRLPHPSRSDKKETVNVYRPLPIRVRRPQGSP